MASLNMNGPYFFNKDKVDEVVTRTSAGNYALGYVNDENAFIVQYVGRADIDVNTRLKQHVGEPYKRFKFSYASVFIPNLGIILPTYYRRYKLASSVNLYRFTHLRRFPPEGKSS